MVSDIPAGAPMAMTKSRAVLIVQPNSTEAMTEALKPIIGDLGFQQVGYLPDHSILSALIDAVYHVVDEIHVLHCKVWP